MRKLLVLLSLFSLAMLSGCSGGGGGGGGYIPPDRVDYFVQLLNDQYAYDGTYYVVKRPEYTLTEDFVVVWNDQTGEYIAYDIRNYVIGDSWATYSAYAEYQEVYIHAVDYDPYLDEYFYYGDAFRNDIWSTYDGVFVFEEVDSQTKDLQKVKAVIEALEDNKKIEGLVELGLSQKDSKKLVKAAKAWEKEAKTRSMTTKDADIFWKDNFGVSAQNVEDAIKAKLEGDNAPAKALIEKAAKEKNISPENTEEILNMIIK